MKKAIGINLIWDTQSVPQGWFVRITREDGQEIDSAPPANDWLERDIDVATACDMIEEALRWEGLTASKEAISDAAESACWE